MNQKNILENSNKNTTSPLEQRLTPKELREKMKDFLYLPKFRDILNAFESNEPGEHYDKKEWINFCFNKDNPVFEFLNEEFIEDFSNYLIERINKLESIKDKPIIILEIGAGNGRLTHFLQQKMELKIPGKVKIIASDNGSWKLKTIFPVEVLQNHRMAVEKFKPKIILFSWIPGNDDNITADFRRDKNVSEYILIGPKDNGEICGDDWLTWGKRNKDISQNLQVWYEKDGFEREDLNNVEKNQICRIDEPIEGYIHNSGVVSFKRNK
jgi:hypothetical protein